MNSAEISEENQKLKLKVGRLVDLSEELLKENTQGSNMIEGFLQEQIKTNNKINEIFLLLVREVEKNDIFKTDAKSADAMLDVIRTLTKTLLHDKESFKREMKFLEKKFGN